MRMKHETDQFTMYQLDQYLQGQYTWFIMGRVFVLAAGTDLDKTHQNGD